MKKELTLASLVRILIRWWWLFLAIAILFAAGAFFYSQHNYHETYQSSTKILVKFTPAANTSTTVSSAINEITYAEKVMNTYVSMLKTNDFKAMARDAYLEKYETTRFPRFSVNFSVIEETQLFQINVTTYDMEASYRLCEIYAECAPKYIEQVTGNPEELSVADSPTMPTAPANSDHGMRNALIAAVFGFVAPFAIFVLVDLFDVSVKSADDLKSICNYPILGEIPDFERHKGNRSKYGKYGYGYGYGSRNTGSAGKTV